MCRILHHHKGIFFVIKVLRESRTKLTAAKFDPKDDFPEDETVRDGETLFVILVNSNTAYLQKGDRVKRERLPRN